MSVFKKLRESRNYSQDELATILRVDVKEIVRWEEYPEEISAHTLSTLAYVFGLSSEELSEARIEGGTKLFTNDYYIFADKNNEDGWWGHFGIRLKGHESSMWFPITLGTANYITSILKNLSSREEWLVVETLNNRILVLKPATLARLWLLDDAQDEPSEDWNIPIDGYSGQPGEFYKGLEEYCHGDEGVSEYVMEQVNEFTDAHDLGTEEVIKMVIETQIFNLEGVEISHYVNDTNLIEIVHGIKSEVPQIIFDLSNDDYDLYIPSDDICLINIPRRSISRELRKLHDDFFLGCQ